MIEFTAAHFEELCACEPVRSQVETLESRRKAAMKAFWLYLTGGIVVAAAALFSLQSAGWEVAAWIVGGLILVAGIGAAVSPLGQIKEALKHPVLEQLAAKSELEYIPFGFTPPAYPPARNLLFGANLSSESFTDLFHGADAEGRGYAVYEACLQRRSGKSTVTVFSGQLYAVHRRPGAKGTTVIVPDRKLFNFFKPSGDMQRVKIEGDPEFEERFEAYSTEPLEAKQLLFDTDLRRRLLALRRSGRVYAYLDADEALVAVSGKDRFEPGTMFRSKPGEERIRLMFDDVCASLAILQDLKARLG
ncbi:MAG: DUF3137 domain-containing protein [Allosphingosinicella sp.]